MLYLRQILIIVGVSFLAEILALVLPVPIPASIYGLVIMFLMLYFKIIKVSQIKESVMFFIEVMPVIFIPAGVGLMLAGDEILENFIPIILILIISTACVIASSAFVTDLLYKFKLKKEQEKLIKKDKI